MIASDDLLDGIRQIAPLETSISAVRLGLFLLGVLAALAWERRQPLLAFLAVTVGGFLGLGYWLTQVASPLGLASDPELTRAWAQAGVNAFAEPKGLGFVLGAEPDTSMVSRLAAMGVPFRIVVLAPQLAAIGVFGLLVLLPFVLLRNRTAAAFAAILAAGGGLWPGQAPYGSLLLRPSALLLAGTLAGILLAMVRGGVMRRKFHRGRLGISAALLAAATLDRARLGGTETGVITAFALCAAAILLSSPLRAAVRVVSSSPPRTRRAEALLLLCVLGGGGLLWWDPPSSVAGFDEARNRYGALQGPMDWIRRSVPKDGVVLASPLFSAPIAAFGGRRVLFPPATTPAEALISLGEQPRREHLLDSARLGRPIAKMAEAFSVTHFFLGPGEPSPQARVDAAPGDEPAMNLVLAYRDAEDFRVFRIERK